ncbi:hypothetical protein [Glycomyces amatae]|nr:hypothetical protein [Glycomyces amatae]
MNPSAAMSMPARVLSGAGGAFDASVDGGEPVALLAVAQLDVTH